MAYSQAAPLAVPVRPGEHACCRFAHAEDRERLAVAFVRDGLRRGDKVVYLFDGDGVALISRLQRLDAAFEPAMSQGQFELRRADDAYIPDCRFEVDRMLALLGSEYDRACAEGYPGLSVTGEIPGAICGLPGGDQLGAYEARLESESERRRSYSILCQYGGARSGCAPEEDAIAAHGVDASPELAGIGRDGDLAAARDRTRGALRLAGELDFGSAQAVSEVLDEHFDSPLRLDLADLSYIDVAGMRALRGHKGQRLIIRPASDAVQRLMPLLAWDTDPDVELFDEAA